jgi:predicted transcriptional regulator
MSLLKSLYAGHAKPTQTVGELADPSIEFVQLTDSIEKVSKIVTAGKTPLVAEEDSGSSEILGIITKIDLLAYIGNR